MGSCLDHPNANRREAPYTRRSTTTTQLEFGEAPPSYEAAQRMQRARHGSHVHQSTDRWSSAIGQKRRALMERLPSVAYSDPRAERRASVNRECVICMLDFTTGDRVKLLPCLHIYHSKCIQDWLHRSFTCPTCMDEIEQSLLRLAAAEADPTEFKWH